MINEKDIKEIAKILNKYYLNFAGDIDKEQQIENNLIFNIQNDLSVLFKQKNFSFDMWDFQDEVLK